MIDLFTYFIYNTLLLFVLGLTYYSRGLYVTSGNDFIDKNYYRLNSKHYLALILIAFVVGFRYEVGADWAGYKYWFDYVANNSGVSFQQQPNEWGYFMITKLAAKAGGSFYLTSFIFAYITWLFIFKSIPVKLLPLLIFFLFTDEQFFSSMNGIRQFVAISIFMYSIRFIIRRDFLRYLFFIFVAALFHYSAILLLPIFYIPFKKLYNQKIWILILILSFIFSHASIIVNGFASLLTKLAEFIPPLGMYLKYLEGAHFQAKEGQLGLGYLFKTLITIFIFIFSKTLIQKYPLTKTYFILFFIGAIIHNLFFSFQIVARFNDYFLIARYFTLAIIISQLLKSNNYRIIAIGVIGFHFFLFLITIYNSANMCSPYRFTFFRF